MDQGVAAFVAGLAGTVGALGGAFIGGVAAIRGARIGAEKAAEAARQQVQDQALVDHDHWLRQQRLEAYTAFLEAYDAHASLAHAASGKAYDLSPGDELPDELEEMITTFIAIRKERQRVKLVGPEAIHTKAVQLEEAVWEYRTALATLAQMTRDANPIAGILTATEQEARRITATAHDSFVRDVGSLLGDRGN